MTVCCVTGDKMQEYLISEVTKKVAAGAELVVVMSEQITFTDYNALGKPMSLPELTQLLCTRISVNNSNPLVVVLPDLSAPAESFSNFFRYIRLSSHLPIDIFIGMSSSEIAPQLNKFATVKIYATAKRIYIDHKYEYIDRGRINDVIYATLVAKKNGVVNS